MNLFDFKQKKTKISKKIVFPMIDRVNLSKILLIVYFYFKQKDKDNYQDLII